MKMGTKLLSFLAAGVLCVQGGIMTAAEEPSLLCQRRSYQEVSVSDFVSSSYKLTRQNSDYQEIQSLGEEIVESVNLWLGVHLERPLQIQDIQWEHFYKIYITLEDLYSIQTTQDLLETLETGYAKWEGYIFLEEDVVSVQLEQHSDQGENHWTVVSAGFTEPEYMPGYDAAIKAGMDASSQEVSQAVLVCSGNGMTVCLLCSDTIDTMVTVSETEVIGDADALCLSKTFLFPALSQRTVSLIFVKWQPIRNLFHRNFLFLKFRKADGWLERCRRWIIVGLLSGIKYSGQVSGWSWAWPSLPLLQPLAC